MHTVLHLISLVSWCLESYLIHILVGYVMAIGSAGKSCQLDRLQKVVTHVLHMGTRFNTDTAITIRETSAGLVDHLTPMSAVFLYGDMCIWSGGSVSRCYSSAT